MQAVDGVAQFKQILKHNSNVIRAMLSIEVGSYVSCIDLLHTLKTEKCDQCGDFAGYVYLLDCSRVCFLCFTEEIHYLPLTAAQVRRKFDIDRPLLFGLPSIKSLSGRYSPNEKLCPKRLVLYDHESARQAGVAMHGSQAAMSQSAADSRSRQMENYDKRRQEYLDGGLGSKPRMRSSTSDEIDGCSSNPSRFMAIVHASWMSSATGVPLSGFHCAGCRRENRSRLLHWRRKFTEKTFEDHIRQSGSIRDGKHCKAF